MERTPLSWNQEANSSVEATSQCRWDRKIEQNWDVDTHRPRLPTPRLPDMRYRKPWCFKTIIIGVLWVLTCFLTSAEREGKRETQWRFQLTFSRGNLEQHLELQNFARFSDFGNLTVLQISVLVSVTVIISNKIIQNLHDSCLFPQGQPARGDYVPLHT